MSNHLEKTYQHIIFQTELIKTARSYTMQIKLMASKMCLGLQV